MKTLHQASLLDLMMEPEADHCDDGGEEAHIEVSSDMRAIIPWIEPSSQETLRAAQERLTSGLTKGMGCPCCGRMAKVYKRKINETMAKGLLWLVRSYHSAKKIHPSSPGWVNVASNAPRAIVQSNQLPTLRWWGLVERMPEEEGSKKKHSGLWRPTEHGIALVEGRHRVPDAVYTLFGHPIGFSDNLVFLDECNGGFSYPDVMSWVDKQLSGKF